MLGKLFGFRGRMGRLPYFGWVNLAFVFALFWIFAVLGGFATGLAKGSGGTLFGSGLLALVGVVPFVWMFLALATKRLRDAGFPPLIVVPAMMAFSLFDMFVLSRQTGGQPISGLLHNSPVGLCVNVLYGCVLLFWPSARETGESDGGASRSPGERPWHERALTIAATLPKEPAPAAYPYQSRAQGPSSGQPRTFGRRMA